MYPPLAYFQGYASIRESPLLYFAAKRFCSNFPRDLQGIASEHADSGVNLPCGIPMEALSTTNWRLRLAVSATDLIKSSTSSHANVVARYMNTVDEMLRMHLNTRIIPLDYASDTWKYRTDIESYYLTEFMRWGERDSIGKSDSWWSGNEGVSQGAMFWTRPLVCQGYKRIKRNEDPFFTKILRLNGSFAPTATSSLLIK